MYLTDERGYLVQEVEGPTDIDEKLLVAAMPSPDLRQPRWDGKQWVEGGAPIAAARGLARRKLMARQEVERYVEIGLTALRSKGVRQAVLDRKYAEALAAEAGGEDPPLLRAEAEATKRSVQDLVQAVLERRRAAEAEENALEVLGQEAKAAIDRARSTSGVDRAVTAFMKALADRRNPAPEPIESPRD